MHLDIDVPLIDLIDALMMLKTKENMQKFLKDLCTRQELCALQERWRVCQFLETKKYTYREIHTLTGASLTTIGRVARFLNDEPYQGYRFLLNKIYEDNL